jgi:hypothetical protein
MPCFTVKYTHRFGVFSSSKWAETPEDALSMVKVVHKKNGLSTAVGHITYEAATLVTPEPFMDGAAHVPAPVVAPQKPKPAPKPKEAGELSFSLSSDGGNLLRAA